MKSFKNYLTEARRFPGEDVLDKAPTVPKDQNWLHKHNISDWTDDDSEVKIKDLGMKMVDKEHISQKLKHPDKPHKYNQAAPQRVELSKVHYMQPSVNREKIRRLMSDYNDSPEHWHDDKNVRKWEGPSVVKYPDGTYVAHDNHRLVAAHLRGDTHTFARVYTYGLGPNGTLVNEKTKAEQKPGSAPKAPKPKTPKK